MSKSLCPHCFFSLFHALFLLVKSKNQHRSAPYPLFNHEQMVMADVFKHENFKSCSYTPMESSKLVVVLIIIDFSGYFKQPHLKILTLSPLCFNLPLEELVRTALYIMKVDWYEEKCLDYFMRKFQSVYLFIKQLEMLLMKVDRARVSCLRRPTPTLLQACAVTAWLCMSSCWQHFYPSICMGKNGIGISYTLS